MSRQMVFPLIMLTCIAAFPCFAAETAEGPVSVDARTVSSGTPSVYWEIAIDGDQMGGTSFDKLKVEVSDADGRNLVSQWHPVEPPIRQGKHTLRGTTQIPALYAQKEKRFNVTVYGRGKSLSASASVKNDGNNPGYRPISERSQVHTYGYEPVCRSSYTKGRVSNYRDESASRTRVSHQIYIDNHGIGLGTSIGWHSSPYADWRFDYGAPVYYYRHGWPRTYWYRPRASVTSSWRWRTRPRCRSHFRTGISFRWNLWD